MKKLQIKPSVFQNAKDFNGWFSSFCVSTIAHAPNWETELDSAFLPKALQTRYKNISLYEVLNDFLSVHIASSELSNAGFMTTEGGAFCG